MTMTITLTYEQEKILRTLMARYNDLSMEEVLSKALLCLEAKDGFDLNDYMVEEDIEKLIVSIEDARRRGQYLTSDEMEQWAASFGRSMHERLAG